ncbi:conjugal transfer protein MobB [Flavobacterium johnsoniae]|uniref:Bacteroides conjugative transposon BmgA/MocA-like protein n=1 Tax=Flavobacterium johnsoniae (strain ATCC 17061 / DSM 2064 / JCM 8514 / BCRC 14874 / CCUG 350202 / NBRC 14942 / NCIMB 11054 / UW101) TaxID=376686 RepID=A5FFH4_FLAJ1|nr:conjugal transfer protein MobB [Flavobacterium johnsoniae]ABQ06039.1 Bacteroides conjugative transposon BmgA/MocA-like protein [Flavobacterium johnsoniae UW101]OXG00596.1 relaxase [Flavobacterium johnsoniae UW101]WQG81777.1 conjugal transfer protein MobB [Flavobacterium johnsoniae UW101]SHK63960.1 Relaxase/Mobilisation nuclease domain-containing protein [Flavobacterium johnsoniae]
MIAKIGRSSNLYGALAYNQQKVDKQKGRILFSNKMIETADAKYSVAQLAQSFAPYLAVNRRTEKHTLHISLNPDPKDDVSDEKFRKMAERYMREMGFAEQPYVVFKHTDIARRHIHIVTVCVDGQGKKISDKFEKMRSMKICRDLESDFGLRKATDGRQNEKEKILLPVHYAADELKSQITAVLRHLPDLYSFQSLGEYNALLSLFNITCDKIEGELQGRMRSGLLYFPLNEIGQKAGRPLKASRLGTKAGLESLNRHFSKSRLEMKDSPVRRHLQTAVSKAFLSSHDEQSFKKLLAEIGVTAVLRRNDNGRMYGATFVDHHSKSVWNGSRLAKELSANSLNEHWKDGNKKQIENSTLQQSKFSDLQNMDSSPQDQHHFFEFLNTNLVHNEKLVMELVTLLPTMQDENFEELQFARKIRKRTKRRN